MFDHLGRFVVRRWIWILAAWAIAVVGVQWAAPPWKSISQDDDVRFFPADFPSVRGYRLLEKAFPRDVAGSTFVIVVERPDAKLSPGDFDFVDALAQRLTQIGAQFRDQDYRLGPAETYKTPVKGELLKAKDERASLVLVPCGWPFMAEKVIHITDHLRREIATMRSRGEVPPGLQIAVTGSTAVGADIQKASTESLERSKWTTVFLVIASLLAVYRAPTVAFIPLVTITVSVVAAMSTMALLTQVRWLNFQVMKITDIFVIVVLFGAGTDYCLFLIARYREELQRGVPRPDALQRAIRDVGGALAASAGTVVVGLGMMIFADFVKIRYTGPAVAIALSVALLASLTLAPALLRAFGRLVFWPAEPQPNGHLLDEAESDDGPDTPGNRFWRWVSRAIAARPGLIFCASVAVMAPFALWGSQLSPTYDFLAELKLERESKLGSNTIRKHFAPGELGPLTVLIEAPATLTGEDGRPTPEARAAIAQLTAEIGKMRHVAYVRSLTSPVGRPLTEPPPGKEPAATNPLVNLLKPAAKAVGDLQRTMILDHYVSQPAQQKVTRLDVVFNVPPFSLESMMLLDEIDVHMKDVTARAGSVFSRGTHALAGTPANLSDLRRITMTDQRRVNWLTIAGVYVVLVMLLRRPGICVYLMITVLFSYYATLGVTEGVFRLVARGWGEPFLGLDWKVSFFLFVILVAVGEDYNIFLMSRVVEEERKWGLIDGVRVAVARTGGIITSCGLIMCGTFGSMAAGSLTAIIELGFALAFGVLLDTFVVRPILVPSFLVLLARFRDLRRDRFRPQSRSSVTPADRPAESAVS